MTMDNRKPGIERRALLKGLGLGTAGAVAAATVAQAADPAEAPEEREKARYRENDHVKRYYALNRL